MSTFERLARFTDQVFDRLRDKRAFGVSEATAVDSGLEALRGHKHAVLVTFRRNGEAVPSPVWFAVDVAGRAYVKTWRGAGKAKRLRNDSRIVIAPSSMRGKPTGPAILATGRLLPKDQWPHAEATLAAAYGAARKSSERMSGNQEGVAVYIEVTPRSGDPNRPQ